MKGNGQENRGRSPNSLLNTVVQKSGTSDGSQGTDNKEAAARPKVLLNKGGECNQKDEETTLTVTMPRSQTKLAAVPRG